MVQPNTFARLGDAGMQTLNSTSESEALLLAASVRLLAQVLTKPMPKESSFHVLEKR